MRAELLIYTQLSTRPCCSDRIWNLVDLKPSATAFPIAAVESKCRAFKENCLLPKRRTRCIACLRENIDCILSHFVGSSANPCSGKQYLRKGHYSCLERLPLTVFFFRQHSHETSPGRAEVGFEPGRWASHDVPGKPLVVNWLVFTIEAKIVSLNSPAIGVTAATYMPHSRCF